MSAALPVEVEGAAKRGGFGAAEYNHVAMTASMQSIRLVRLDFDIRPELLDDAAEATLAFDRKVVSCRFDEERRVAAAIFQFGVTARSGRARALRLVAEYAVVYGMTDEAKAEAATSFCKHVGSFAAYPYFRAVAAQMAWNAGVDLPPLPTIAAMPRVPAKQDASEAEARTR